MKILLKLFSNKKLWKEIIRREGFTVESEIGNASAWINVFHRTPEIKDWMRRREVMLLKSSTLGDRTSDFILGQIAECRLWQHYDIPGKTEIKVETKIEEPKVPDKKNFLEKWSKESTEKGVGIKEEKETV